jgi:hypothetical protein
MKIVEKAEKYIQWDNIRLKPSVKNYKYEALQLKREPEYFSAFGQNSPESE